MTPEEVLADPVLAAGRRRRRRRSAWIVGGVLAAAIAVAVPLLAVPDGRVAADDAAAAADTTTSRARAGASTPVTDEALIYAAALSEGTTASSGRSDVFVRDYVCTTVISKPGSQCADAPIPMSVRREVAQLLPFPVRFVGQVWGPRNGPEKSLTVLGTLTGAHGNRATLEIETLCGLLCGEGKTLVLARTGDGWRVTGQTGPEWVS
jgi:hypothetical protein